jgi:hypothetical protein
VSRATVESVAAWLTRRMNEFNPLPSFACSWWAKAVG